MPLFRRQRGRFFVYERPEHSTAASCPWSTSTCARDKTRPPCLENCTPSPLSCQPHRPTRAASHKAYDVSLIAKLAASLRAGWHLPRPTWRMKHLAEPVTSPSCRLAASGACSCYCRFEPERWLVARAENGVLCLQAHMRGSRQPWTTMERPCQKTALLPCAPKHVAHFDACDWDTTMVPSFALLRSCRPSSAMPN
jgi:hypothetical protein